jgi:hypothetical protein
MRAFPTLSSDSAHIETVRLQEDFKIDKVDSSGGKVVIPFGE